MMGYGKSSRYELHPPMTLGDVLAALFRRKPKKAAARTFPAVGSKTRENNGPEPKLLRSKDRPDGQFAGLESE